MPSASWDGIFELLGHKWIWNKSHSLPWNVGCVWLKDTVLEGATLNGGWWRIFQGSNEVLRVGLYHHPLSLLPTLSWEQGTERTALPPGHWTNADMTLRGAWGSRGPCRPCQLGTKAEAFAPLRCSIWERSPGPGLITVGNNRPWERAACAAAWALSALASWLGVEVGGGEGDRDWWGEERSSSHCPTSHIPSASLGNNHTPHTEETQSTDSGFLDTPVASKNSQAMTKQIGIWTANNSSTSLLGSTQAYPCWALPPLPSPVSETVSGCWTPQPKCELEGLSEPPEWVLFGAGVFCLATPTWLPCIGALCHSILTQKTHSIATCSCVCAPTPSQAADPSVFVTTCGFPGTSIPGLLF